MYKSWHYAQSKKESILCDNIAIIAWQYFWTIYSQCVFLFNRSMFSCLYRFMFRHWTKPSNSCGEAEILYQRFQICLLVNAAFKMELSNFRLQQKETLGRFVNLSVWRGCGEILRAVLFVVSALQPSLSKRPFKGLQKNNMQHFFFFLFVFLRGQLLCKNYAVGQSLSQGWKNPVAKAHLATVG